MSSKKISAIFFCLAGVVALGWITIYWVFDSAPSAAITQLYQPSCVRQTYTYKEIDEVQIKADVYRVENGKKQAAVVWIHGGGLIVGSRRYMPPYLKLFCRQQGVTLISIDYRLAPEVKLPEIYEDVADALTWVRKTGPKFLNIDPSRLAVMGHSAGGYLSLLLGSQANSELRAIVVLSGYVDLTGNWLTQPSPSHLENQKRLTKGEVENAIGTGTLTDVPWNSRIREQRSRYYDYLRQTGTWPKHVVGFDPFSERDKFLPFLPLQHISSAFPPSLLIHGIDDPEVPVDQLQIVANLLARLGVYHEFLKIPNTGHNLYDMDKMEVRAAMQQIPRFLKEQLAEH